MFDKDGNPMTEPTTTPSQLAIDLARELYDRFVMGGWEPQDAHAQIDAMIANAKAAPVSAEGERKAALKDLEKPREHL